MHSHSTSTHISVLLKPTIHCLLGLEPNADTPTDKKHGVYVDATFGRGGHTRYLLECLDSNSRVIAFDKDPEALAIGNVLAKQDPRLTMLHASFAEVSSKLADLGITELDGITADLGVSSPQLDDASRGFSFMHDGPLDMRMDNTSGKSASQWLSDIDESELANVLYRYGDERYSRRIAAAIKRACPISSTHLLAETIKEAHPKWDKHKHPATRSFQAIRIAVNNELGDVEVFLPQCLNLIRIGARLAIISFHSLEDRLVKQFIQLHSTDQINDFGLLKPNGAKKLKKIARIAPNSVELEANYRARSAWMRVAQKIR